MRKSNSESLKKCGKKFEKLVISVGKKFLNLVRNVEKNFQKKIPLKYS